jgi:CYTH domain-containing protein
MITIKEKQAQIEELDRKSSNFEIMLKDTQRLLDELLSDLMRERTR